MEGFKETEIGLIPDDWNVDILSKYSAKPQYGFTDSASHKGNAKFLRITDITEQGVDWSTVPFCNCPEKKITKYLLTDDDILFARIGATTGKSYIIKNPPKAIYASYLIRVRTQKGLNPDFLYQYFNSEYYWDQINSQKGNSLKGGVNGSILSNLLVVVPNLSEQKSIAQILTTIQHAIEKQQALIVRTTELKKALMHKLFTEGTQGEAQKETEIGLVPESWEVVPIGKYAKVLNGFAFKSKDYVSKGVQLIRISNVSFGFLIDKDNKYLPESYLKTHKSVALQNGDLILSLTRPIVQGGMKYCFIEERHLPAFLNQRVGKFEITNDNLLKSYLFHIIFSNYFVEELRIVAEGSNQPNVSPKKLEQFLIPIPSDRNEQEKIANILTNINSKIDNHKTKKEYLKSLFKTMLHQLMTGKIRVKDIEF